MVSGTRTLVLIILSLSTVLAASSYASVEIGPNSSWEEIGHAGLWAKFPKIEFVVAEKSGEKTIQVPVVNTCVVGTELQARTPWAAETLSKVITAEDTETYSIPVVQNFGANPGEEKTAFVKTFTLPSCN